MLSASPLMFSINPSDSPALHSRLRIVQFFQVSMKSPSSSPSGANTKSNLVPAKSSLMYSGPVNKRSADHEKLCFPAPVTAGAKESIV